MANTKSKALEPRSRRCFRSVRRSRLIAGIFYSFLIVELLTQLDYRTFPIHNKTEIGRHAMSQDTELLTEIRDLLQVMAEPLLEKRHKKFRDGIRQVVGKKQSARGAVLLMDG